jgi:hypothetical protein
MDEIEQKIQADIEASIRAIKDGYAGDPEKLNNWVEIIITILAQYKHQYVRARKSAERVEEVVGIIRDKLVRAQQQLEDAKAWSALPWWKRLMVKNPLRMEGGKTHRRST